ncbi:MAG: sigma-54-dependent Fis family transcriptional regulator, partial [Deltaproteobacteria bacterium]|nr:sigma-54-dependent Fis family transcriptional regulator [Deltaproteobacteria bacterium]
MLVVDDDPDTTDSIRDTLRRRGFEAHGLYSADDALEWLKTREATVVISDVQMPGTTGIELCAKLREDYPNIRVIILTGAGSLDIAIQAIRAGAFDYIAKPVQGDALALATSRALDHVALEREVKRLRTLVRVAADGLIIGDCPPIKKTMEMIGRVTESDATVLILGESGTGKELVARALHDMGPRKDQPFVAVNCAAMPAPLLESELFGHLRGAFTDAKQTRHGLFMQAGAGTIFLDGVGEMPLDMQAKLLRALQERTVRPVGGDEEVPFQARVITATNRDLEKEVRRKRFREDLFYRINVVAIPVPPLRVRGSDILVLAQYFLQRIASRNHKPVVGISASAARLLMRYDWPGNVRELENCIERAVALCRLDEITVEDLPQKIQNHGNELAVAIGSPRELITLDEME